MILVAGSANLDFVVRAGHIPGPGETVLGYGFKTYPGGKGANQAVACSRAGGASTQMLVAFGDDTFATTLEASLQAAGVGLHIVSVPDTPTGTAFICVSDNAENAITVAPGANAALTATNLPPLTGYSHLLMQLETPLATVTACARLARSAGVKVVLNAAPAQPLPAELLALVDILVVNEGELAAIAAHSGTVVECLERVPAPIVVVTLGERGCCARVDGQYVLQSAFPVQPLDTTAAGDTFCGTLVAALDHGLGLATALRRASAAAGLACTQPGAQSSIPTQQAVDDLIGQTAHDPSDELHALRMYCGLAASRLNP
ncbi:MAG: ribokinase [Rhodoferax sp.]|nr:ribokinase [Rhodoferax sp.]